MMIIDKQGDNLKQLCICLAKYLSHSEIDDVLFRCGFNDISIKSQQFALGYIPGDNKVERIYKNFANELNTSKSDSKIIAFIESVMKPSKYVDVQSTFNDRILELNKILLFMGCEINVQGKINYGHKADTIDEVNVRINNLQYELEKRNINKRVYFYCSREYLAKDYFHACFEAVKGIYDRLRELTDIKDLDGYNLIKKVFDPDRPMIVINSHQTQTEKDEFKGLGNLILGLHQMVRNPDAHTVRIKKETELNECLDILTIVSLVHNYLDIAQRINIYS